MKTYYLNQSIKIYYNHVTSDSIFQDLNDTDILNYRIRTFNAGAYTTIIPYTNILPVPVSLGRYELQIDLSDLLFTTGRYFIDFTLNGEKQFEKEFEIIQNEIPYLDQDHYCLIQDLRDQGLTTQTDYELFQAILKATEYIQRYTAQNFGSRYVTMKIKARHNKIVFTDPICALQYVNDDIPTSDYKVYARHLRGFLGTPGIGGTDDRSFSLIENIFTKNELYDITGLFGYTEYDGSAGGKIPDQIRLAGIKLALMYQANLLGTSGSSGGGSSVSDRVIKEKTATQSYELQPLPENLVTSSVLGDTELTRLLTPYRRSWQIRSV